MSESGKSRSLALRSLLLSIWTRSRRKLTRRGTRRSFMKGRPVWIESPNRGAYFSEGSLTTPVDLVAFPWFFKWALGGYSKQGEGPYTHTFFPQQSPLMKSFTARVGKDIFEHVFTGMVVSTLELALEDQLLLGTVEIDRKSVV